MLLGNHLLQKKTFRGVDALLKRLRSFKGRIRSEKTNRALLEKIRKEPEPCFLLSSVLDFIERVDRDGLIGRYTFSSFELWLNQASNLSFEENLHIRAKIIGKRIDRSAYQGLFPIGMGKVYEGTHFVTAHKSPDLDTTIASFWGWVDAFGARVGNSLHVWNLPGGPPSSQIEIRWVFSDVFGSAVFTHLARTRNELNLTGKDLMTQKGLVLKTLSDSIGNAEHERDHEAVVIVDKEGFYLGDWRSVDVEEVRQAIILLSMCLRWFENHLHLHLISLFAKQNVRFEQMLSCLRDLLAMKVEDCVPAQEFTDKQDHQVSRFISLVLEIPEGLEISFEQLGICLARLSSVPFKGPEKLLREVRALFDKQGKLKEHRPRIFSFLEVAVRELHEAILKIRIRLEKFDIALKAKMLVCQRHPTFVTMRSDVEEIKQKMGSYASLTVTQADDGKVFPVGRIQAEDIRKSILGTVSLRDFCNRDEMTIPQYLDVISVIDHHKSQLNTFSPPIAIIADVQSSNTLVAEQAFAINDRVSLGGQTKARIEKQIASKPSSRLMQRLLQKRLAAEQKGHFFVSPEREYLEYLHFLYAILDDTDLLSKVSASDIECVASLLNRMKTLLEKKETEIVALDDIPRDKHFPKLAAKRILQNEDMYSLYKKVYAHREKEIEECILRAAKDKASNFFADTKTQNGCCRVGQTKVFASNRVLFEKHAQAIEHVWFDEAVRIQKEKPEIDLHMHMISTIVSAEEVYEGKNGVYAHTDEMWIWAPLQQDMAVEHLKRFLGAFQSSPGLKNNPMDVEFLGTQAKEYQAIFQESFLEVPSKVSKGEMSFVILRYKAGSLNSRKAMVSPFLPTLTLGS